MSHQCHHSSPFHVSCFRPSPTADDDNHHVAPPTPPRTSGKTDIATTLYHTSLGLFSLAWSRTFLGQSLHLHLHPPPASLSFSTLHFHLHIKPFIFWKKYGYKKLSSPTISNDVKVFWDLSRARFGSGPEPDSGFYVAVVVDGEVTLLVGDCTKEAFARTRARKPAVRTQALVLRREHVVGNQVYNTKARFGGKNREISIDCRVNEESKLCFSVDKKRVLQIKRLEWKFRGNERIEVDGVPIQVSWDVYNWLFDRDLNGLGHAVFMFKFETDGSENHEEDEVEDEVASPLNEKKGVVSSSFGKKREIEWRKMGRKSLLKSGGGSSSSSMLSLSSGSSGGSSSVTEWGSVEETELSAPNGFSLLVYAWRN
ncbi:hypothetical protein V6N13_031249 [Hibiscus sabdariffa]|uniref:DUF868 family protein n=2 Tax=Hibiscus sabdariffa TaxID=183260 RepID=A0ABR2CKW9_9ROSI